MNVPTNSAASALDLIEVPPLFEGLCRLLKAFDPACIMNGRAHLNDARAQNAFINACKEMFVALPSGKGSGGWL
jgi:hypothetical protein